MQPLTPKKREPKKKRASVAELGSISSYKFFVYPFGVDGNLTDIPDEAQVDQQVSYQQGFTPLYSLNLATDPSALKIDRANFNELAYDITLCLSQYQTQGTPLFVTSMQNLGASYSYSQFAYALYDAGGGLQEYQSLIDSNTTTPSETSTTWVNKNRLPMLWNAAQTYLINDFVTYQNSMYVSLINANTNNTPSSNPDKWQEYVAASGAMARGVYIGLTPSVLSNIATIKPGSCSFFGSASIGTITATWTKTSSAWAAGTGMGGVLSLNNDDWSYLFMISDGVNIDFAIDDNLSCTNIPAGYTQYRRVGLVYSPDGTNLSNSYYDGNNYYSDQISTIPVPQFAISQMVSINTVYNASTDRSIYFPSGIDIDVQIKFTYRGVFAAAQFQQDYAYLFNLYSTLQSTYVPSLVFTNSITIDTATDGALIYDYATVSTLQLSGIGAQGTKRIVWGTSTRDLVFNIINKAGAGQPSGMLCNIVFDYLVDNFSDF